MDDNPRREDTADDDPLDLFASEGGESADPLLDAWSEYEPVAGSEPVRHQPPPPVYQKAPRTGAASLGGRRLVIVAVASMLVAITFIGTRLLSGDADTVASSAPAQPAHAPDRSIPATAPLESAGPATGTPAPAVVDRSPGQAGRDTGAVAVPTPRADPAQAGRETREPAVGVDAGRSGVDVRLREALAVSDALLTPPRASSPTVLSDTGAAPAPAPATPSAGSPLLSAAPPVLIPSEPPPPREAAPPAAAASTGAENRPAASGSDVARAAPPPAPVPVREPVPVRSLIQGVLDEYRDALNALDSAAARAVWPSADERMLNRAFESVQEQKVEFSCKITPVGSTASATCVGTWSFIPKVGNKTWKTETRQWEFKLRERNETWFIDGLTTR